VPQTGPTGLAESPGGDAISAMSEKPDPMGRRKQNQVDLLERALRIP
jgi:hypothetical protein